MTGAKFSQEFKPTRLMRAYAYQRAKLGDSATEAEISGKVPVHPSTISNWKAVQGFEPWLHVQVAIYRTPIVDMLEQIALDRAPDDFRYWEAMAKKYGVIAKDGGNPPGDGGGIRMTPDELIEVVKRVRAESHVKAAVVATTQAQVAGDPPSG